MKKEIEVKIRVDDFSEVEDKLSDCNSSDWKFEDNYIFDREGELKKSGKLLRVRFVDGKVFLTYKEKLGDDLRFKRRNEIELGVSGKEIVDLLKGLGYKVFFRYQKKRKNIVCGNVKISFDDTPIGKFVEIEADDEKKLEDFIKNLSLENRELIKKTYYELFREIHPTGDMVFK